MRVFITGASGFIGNAVALAFKANGHTVYGLTRNPDRASELQKHEIIPVIGQLEKIDTYQSYLSQTEVWVHCAFENSSEGVEKDAVAVNGLVHAAQGSYLPKTLIYTSGVWVYGDTKGKIVDEASMLNPFDIVQWRPAHEDRVLNIPSKSIKSVVIRPGYVYGGSGSLTDAWFRDAENGQLSVIEGGKNRWAMIHRQDLASAYVLAAEKGVSGAVFNIVDSSRCTVAEIAEEIYTNLGMQKKVANLSSTEAKNKFGLLAEPFAASQMISNEKARRLLGWLPQQPQFIESISNLYSTWKAYQN